MTPFTNNPDLRRLRIETCREMSPWLIALSHPRPWFDRTYLRSIPVAACVARYSAAQPLRRRPKGGVLHATAQQLVRNRQPALQRIQGKASQLRTENLWPRTRRG